MRDGRCAELFQSCSPCLQRSPASNAQTIIINSSTRLAPGGRKKKSPQSENVIVAARKKANNEYRRNQERYNYMLQFTHREGCQPKQTLGRARLEFWQTTWRQSYADLLIDEKEKRISEVGRD
ncbi:hypothetical protein CDAR_90991 [Caerostris darwini]|uniref:Uncharacterized protein n=1 Tax=Caerostris darwini TaxID=1538125 RepID=A0AAV4QBL3_9ARAC|nr:hypothetical protein CDAR_90991 [Caerostris darwini]